MNLKKTVVYEVIPFLRFNRTGNYGFTCRANTVFLAFHDDALCTEVQRYRHVALLRVLPEGGRRRERNF